jgi:DNA polymerase-3 subunit epsilon/ATP-dependent DNA helicase DinG
MDRAHGKRGVCPLHHARLAAMGAHIVVAPHDMLLSDVLPQPGQETAPDRVLPDYQHVLVAEAHDLEDSCAEGLRKRLDGPMLKRMAAGLPPILADMVAALRGASPALTEKAMSGLEQGVGVMNQAAESMAYHVENLFAALTAFLETDSGVKPGEYGVQVRLSDDMRHKPSFGQVRAAWSILGQFTEALATSLNQLVLRLAKLRDKHTWPETAPGVSEIGITAQAFNVAHRWLEKCFAVRASGDTVFWVDYGTRYLALHSAPLALAGALQRHVWSQVKSALLTDSTLRTPTPAQGGTPDDDFGFLRARLGAQDFVAVQGQAHTATQDADKAGKLLFFLPSDMPEPAAKDFPKAVERGVIELVTACPGRVVALFTSYSSLRQSAGNIASRLALGDIPVFDQSDGTSQRILLAGFLGATRGVLLGVRGFWEDVGLRGDDCDALVIVRLPFPVPSDPLFGARSEQYDDALHQYTVPYSALRFQRSIDQIMAARTRPGVVALLDKRLITREYGASFLDRLGGGPQSEQRRAPLSELASAAKSWLV